MNARVALGILVWLAGSAAANGQTWERLGPAGGMVLTLESGAGAVVYLGTADGHVFAEPASGKDWELRGRVGARTDAVVTRLLASPDTAGLLYAAVWYREPGAGGGVFRSEDGGRSWKLLGLGQEAVRALEFSAAPPRVMVAGTRRGVFRSADEGKSWERISPEGDPELRNVDSLAIDPRDAKIIYAGTYHLPWKTSDGGKSWEAIASGLIDDSDIMSLRIDASNPERIFLSACSGIYRSENRGSSWSKLQGVPYAARRTQAIVQDVMNPRILYAATTEGLWVTADGGESWSRTTPKEWVVNSVAVVRDSGNGGERVILGTESQSVQSSEDSGKGFVDGNRGFGHQVVGQLIGDKRDASHLYAMMEWGGKSLWESVDAGRNWTALPPAQRKNKKGVLGASETVQQMYASPWGCMVRLVGGRLLLLDREGWKWKEWKLRISEKTAVKMRPLAKTAGRKAASTGELLLLDGSAVEFSKESGYVATREGLLRCGVAGNCARLMVFAKTGAVSAMHVSPDGSVLSAVVDGKLMHARDGGQEATRSELPVSRGAILWVDEWEEKGDSELFLGTTEGLFASAGEGWKRAGRGLPAGQVEGLLRGHGFLAVTLREGGLYISDDAGQTWKREDGESERGRFTGMVETAPGELTVGSQSEGVLHLKLQ